MKAFSLNSVSLERNKNIYSGILFGASVFAFTVLTVSFIAPNIGANAATQTAEQTVGPHTMSMSNDSAATIDITPTNTQTIYNTTNNLTVSNTCSAGATITMKTSGENNALIRPAISGDTLTKEIPATTSTSLDNTSWGYSLDSGTTWGGVPASNGAAALVYDGTAVATNVTVPVMFGVKVDNTLPSGAYTNDIVYTMTPKGGCLSYSVTWDFNGGNAKADATYPSTLNWGQTIDLSALTPTRDGYTFTGWSVGSSTYTSEETSADLNPSNVAAITVQANWTAICAAGVASETVSLGVNGVKDFDYTGAEKCAILTNPGYYKLEVWGGQGGSEVGNGGYGSYSVGVMQIGQDPLYINVGGEAAHVPSVTTDSTGGYNGGGNAYHWKNNDCINGGGGGATHIATVSGLLKNLSSYKDTGGTNVSKEILIVAGGGGGYGGVPNSLSSNVNKNPGGNAGGTSGNKGTYHSIDGWGSGGTQTTGGVFTSVFSDRGYGKPGGFGYGGDSSRTSDNNSGSTPNGGGSAGGAGWYGGAGSSAGASAGGGSGYIGSSNLLSGAGITKHMTCYSCTTSTVAATRTNSNTNVSATATADYSKTGNGYARITYIGTSI